MEQMEFFQEMVQEQRRHIYTKNESYTLQKMDHRPKCKI